ncbi:hypothetical protein JCM11641_003399 [Rhodosporidiobolus odoratus]
MHKNTHSRLPRSSGSLDLTDISTLVPPASTLPPQPASGSPAHPSLLITDDSGASLPHSHERDDQQLLARFTSAANVLLSHQAPAKPDPAHLSASLSHPSGPNSRALSRISESSEYSAPSAYSSSETPRSSAQLASPTTPPRSPASSRAHSPPLPDFTFPQPPSHETQAHLSILPPPVPPQAYLPNAVLSGPGSPKKHHLPTRPLTTPVPCPNPRQVPVPRDVFARPPGQERVGSPYGGMMMPSEGASREVMVQLPGRGVLVSSAGRGGGGGHRQMDSDSSSAWATAEDEKQYGTGEVTRGGGVFYPGDGYSLSLSQTESNGNSNNRFTLDGDAGESRQRLPTGGWDREEEEEEGEKRGSNRRIWIALVVLALIGVGVGAGVGVGSRKKAEEGRENTAAAASSLVPSSAPSAATSSTYKSPFATVLLPSSSSTTTSSSTSSSPSTAPISYETTFAYSRSGAITVVPLTYTIPTSGIQTRPNGQWQFTEEVVLPAIASASGAQAGEGESFTSQLRFRVAPTSAVGSKKRDLMEERSRDRRERRDSELEEAREKEEKEELRRHMKGRMRRETRVIR